jgi:hypothetical protein
MPIILLGLFAPRLTLFILWLFSGYIARSQISGALAVLGFFFLPATTLAYVIAKVSLDGVQDLGLVLVIVGVFIDLGSHGGGAKRSRRG